MSVRENIEIQKVITDIKGLKKTQRAEVLKTLIRMMDKPSRLSKRKPKLTDLAGLGKEIWKGVNPDEYVRKLRAEWE